MADEIRGIGATAAAAGVPSPSIGGPRDIASRVRDWFLEFYNHPLWVDYRRNAKEDMGFYVGGDGQWSVEGDVADLERLKKDGRAHVSINHVQSIVDVLTGFERQNRFDLKAAPQGNEDVEDARVMSWMLKWVQEQTAAHDVCSDAFEDGVITGMDAVEVPISYQDDPVNGDIQVNRLRPGEEVIWDPYWSAPDLSDARAVIKYKFAFVQDVIAEYPEKEEEILAATSDVDQFRDAGLLTQGDPRDGYGGIRDRVAEYSTARMFYDPAEGKILVAEAYYRDYEDVWIVSDALAGKVYEAESGEAARDSAASDPDHLTAIRRRRRIIKMAVVLPATYQVLEEGNPYENDDQAYPILAYVAKRKGDAIYGMVKNLKDPQRQENKRESQILDILARYANIRPMAEENSLVNPNALKDPWSNEPLMIRNGAQHPGWFAPPLAELFRVLSAVGDRNKMAVREVSGINTDLLGAKNDDASGIAIARRQAQGQVISTVFFDNYRRFRRLLGQRLARRVQQVFTSERTMRLTNESGAEVFVTINPAGLRTMPRDKARAAAAEKKQQIMQNMEKLKYDVVISETPSTPTMRATSLLAILEILKVMPGLAPALMDVVIELAEVPDRANLLERVRALMPPQITGQQQAPPNVSMGGGGGATPPEEVPPPGLQPPTQSSSAAGLPPPAPARTVTQ